MTKSPMLRGLMILSLALGLVAATMQPADADKTKKVLKGTVIGAGVGALIGGKKGAAGGAVVGAIAGASS